MQSEMPSATTRFTMHEMQCSTFTMLACEMSKLLPGQGWSSKLGSAVHA